MPVRRIEDKREIWEIIKQYPDIELAVKELSLTAIGFIFENEKVIYGQFDKPKNLEVTSGRYRR
jgi:hypothetical protein